MTLGEKQRLFTKLTAELIRHTYEDLGYELTYGETMRTSAQAIANAASGAGISNSLHLLRLAVDFNLFINGVWQTDSVTYKLLGDYWKSLHPLCRWGGDFSRPDGNHFSLSHNGIS